MPKVIGLPKVRYTLTDSHTDEETPIVLYFQYNGTRLKCNVGKGVRPKDWDIKRQRAKPSKRFEGNEINDCLNEMADVCLDIYLENNKGRISPEIFRNELRARMDNGKTEVQRPPTFVEFIEQYYQERKQQPNAKSGTLKFLNKVKVHVQKYAQERKIKIEFSELNDRFFSDFRDWLYSPPRLLNTNYVHRIFKYIRHFASKAEVRGLHTNRAYLGFKVPSVPITKIALSFAQLEHLYSLDFSHNTRLEKARDLFLIGAYTGLRFSDFTRIRPERITENEGQRFIQITTEKTTQTVHIPLSPILEAVLNKYGFTSPAISNQKMNDYLKEIGQTAGFTAQIMVNDYTGGIRKEKVKFFWEKLTTHVARRSFATNYYRKYPHLIDNIMRITGHTTEVQFRNYIVVDGLNSAIEFGKATAELQNQ